MAFLNMSMIKKMAGEATVEKHPMLEKLDVPFNVREAYFQGCVLAGVLKNGTLAGDKRAEVLRLGASLQLSETEVAENINVVTGLASDDAKEQFIGEIFGVLSGDVYPQYFLRDFENLLKENGELSAEMSEYLDCFGSMLYGTENWRGAITKEQSVPPKKDVWAGVRKHLDYNPNDWLYARIRDIFCDKLGLNRAVVDPDMLFSDMDVGESGFAAVGSALLNEIGSYLSPSEIRELGCIGKVYNKILIDKGSDYVRAGEVEAKRAASPQTLANHSGFYIRPDRCVGCGCCIDACPAEAISEGTPYVIDPDTCVCCGACAAQCPNEAIVD